MGNYRHKIDTRNRMIFQESLQCWIEVVYSSVVHVNSNLSLSPATTSPSNLTRFWELAARRHVGAKAGSDSTPERSLAVASSNANSPRNRAEDEEQMGEGEGEGDGATRRKRRE